MNVELEAKGAVELNLSGKHGVHDVPMAKTLSEVGDDGKRCVPTTGRRIASVASGCLKFQLGLCVPPALLSSQPSAEHNW